jgi:hypothetical protein
VITQPDRNAPLAYALVVAVLGVIAVVVTRLVFLAPRTTTVDDSSSVHARYFGFIVAACVLFAAFLVAAIATRRATPPRWAKRWWWAPLMGACVCGGVALEVKGLDLLDRGVHTQATVTGKHRNHTSRSTTCSVDYRFDAVDTSGRRSTQTPSTTVDCWFGYDDVHEGDPIAVVYDPVDPSLNGVGSNRQRSTIVTWVIPSGIALLLGGLIALTARNIWPRRGGA